MGTNNISAVMLVSVLKHINNDKHSSLKAISDDLGICRNNARRILIELKERYGVKITYRGSSYFLEDLGDLSFILL